MSVNGRRRVVITGIGAVTPLANDAETTWQRLLAGESGAGPITQFDSTDYHVQFACEVKDFDPSNWIEHRHARRRRTRVSTSSRTAIASARPSPRGSAASSRFRTATTR